MPPTDPLFDLTPAPAGQAMADLHGLAVDKFLRECVEVFPEAITQEMTNIPGHIAYWTTRYANAQRDFQRAEQALDQLKARKRIHYRTSIAKATVDAVNDAVETDEEYVAARVAVIEAEAIMARTKGYSQAVQTKRDMLMCLGGILRDELRGDPHIKALAQQRAAPSRDPFLNPGG